MKINATTFWLVLVGLVVVVGLFLLAALVVQWLVNVVLGQYGVQPLTYASSLAITGLVVVLSGARRAAE